MVVVVVIGTYWDIVNHDILLNKICSSRYYRNSGLLVRTINHIIRIMMVYNHMQTLVMGLFHTHP